MKLVPSMVAVGAFLAVSTAALAFPTLLPGPTGSIATPTADTTPRGAVDLAADFYDTETTQTWPVKLNFGVSRNAEIGGLFAFNDVSNVWGVNAKYAFPISRKAENDTAIGVVYTNANDVDLKATQLYAVHTHRFSQLKDRNQLRVSVGTNWTSIDTGIDTFDKFRFFASADYTFNRNLALVAEYQSSAKDFPEAKPIMSAAVRFAPAGSWALEAGASNVSPLGVDGTSDMRFFAGVAIRLGKAR